MHRVRILVSLSLAGAALASMPFAASQQPTGEPFSTAIMKVKEGLYVIPGYDGRDPYARHRYESSTARLFQDFRIREHRVLAGREARG